MLIDMNEFPSEDPGTETGPAVVGSDHRLCWTPCHRQPIRIPTAAFEPWIAITATCPRCGTLWAVEFPEPPLGSPPHAVWRRLTDAD